MRTDRLKPPTRKRKAPLPAPDPLPQTSVFEEKSLVPVEVSAAVPANPSPNSPAKKLLGMKNYSVASEMVAVVAVATDVVRKEDHPDAAQKEKEMAQLKKHVENKAALLDELKPTNPIEGMVVSSMVACHSLGLEMLSDRSRVEVYGTYAVKLLRLANECADLLTRLRRTGEQKIIQHVNVEDGGKAIVGNMLGVGPGENNGGSPRA